MFGKKRKEKETQNLQCIVEEVLYNSVVKKKGFGVTFETTDDEDYFFRELVRLMLANGLAPRALYLEPMSNKSFSVSFASYPVGKIGLQGRKTYMQILKGMYGIEELEDRPLNEYISRLPDWIKRMKYCLRD